MQEDYHFINLTQVVDAKVADCHVAVSYSIAGVFDGHGGKKAAEYSSKQVRGNSRVRICEWYAFDDIALQGCQPLIHSPCCVDTCGCDRLDPGAHANRDFQA
jgi:hypothetical protein